MKARVAVVLAISFAAAGCGSDTGYRTVQEGTVRAWVATTDDGGDARADGTVRWLAEPSCWVLEMPTEDGSDPAENRRAIIWPRGTSVAGETPPELAVGSANVREGTVIRGTGAGLEDPPAELDIPSECRPGGVLVLRAVQG